mmetsp:Transcript_38076/g.151154  ORF Transcript_38076/g.151154 Transcript_38076/m.151154 type:complete len:441 (-) Transcript_38076:239-1561(-)
MGADSIMGSTLVRNYIGPMFIMTWSIPFAILQVYCHIHEGGTISGLIESVSSGRALQIVGEELQKNGWNAFVMLACFMAFELVLLLGLPGKKYDGPKTIMGHVPKYRDTGLTAYIITLLTAYLISEQLGWFNLAKVYDYYLAAIVEMNLFALVFCLFLYIKGRTFPSSVDNHFDGIFVADYYRGIELYPRIGKHFDIKMFTNCRFGMMTWPLLPLCFAAKQRELYGEISNSMWLSVALQLIYCAKFFYWERGYMGTTDIMHDRGGYYICWGCLCYLPSTYTVHTLFLTKYPYNYSAPVAALIFIAGVLCIFVNYWADYQRMKVRETDGDCKIWGKKAEIIRAEYTETRDGKREKKKSILLCSGFWGVTRHFHYVPEILASVFWACPIGHGLILPYFYVIFLTLLLFHRAGRDDRKCSGKYGSYWTEYCKKVPYRIIPYVY